MPARPWNGAASSLGRHALRSLRFHTVALLMGDPETALATARRGVAAGNEQAWFVHLAALWQVAGRDAAQEEATRAIAMGDDRRLRAVVRFFEFADKPELAERAMDEMRAPDAALLLAGAEAWRWDSECPSVPSRSWIGPSRSSPATGAPSTSGRARTAISACCAGPGARRSAAEPRGRRAAACFIWSSARFRTTRADRRTARTTPCSRSARRSSTRTS